jgi:nitroreductase
VQYDSFFELVKNRRSIRRFKPDPVPEEYVMKIIEAARWAMSGANAQPWEFIIVKDTETKNKIANSILEQRMTEVKLELTRRKDLRQPMYLIKPPVKFTLSLSEAPVLIVVCGDRRPTMASVLSQNWEIGEGDTGAVFYKDMATTTMVLHLAAAALGLGSQWCSIARSTEARIRSILDIPELIEVHTIVPIGYPAYDPAPPYRRELDELVHFGKYDRNKYRSIDDILNFIILLRQQTTPGYLKVKQR